MNYSDAYLNIQDMCLSGLLSETIDVTCVFILICFDISILMHGRDSRGKLKAPAFRLRLKKVFSLIILSELT